MADGEGRQKNRVWRVRRAYEDHNLVIRAMSPSGSPAGVGPCLS